MVGGRFVQRTVELATSGGDSVVDVPRNRAEGEAERDARDERRADAGDGEDAGERRGARRAVVASKVPLASHVQGVGSVVRVHRGTHSKALRGEGEVVVTLRGCVRIHTRIRGEGRHRTRERDGRGGRDDQPRQERRQATHREDGSLVRRRSCLCRARLKNRSTSRKRSSKSGWER